MMYSDPTLALAVEKRIQQFRAENIMPLRDRHNVSTALAKFLSATPSRAGRAFRCMDLRFPVRTQIVGAVRRGVQIAPERVHLPDEVYLPVSSLSAYKRI